MIPAVLLMGPTASGKSALAMALAERFPVEIVSVDSAQVYRGMDIGTAKPDAAVRARVPHHLIDIIDPIEAYSAARFRADALAAIAAIRARGARAARRRRNDALLQGAARRPVRAAARRSGAARAARRARRGGGLAGAARRARARRSGDRGAPRARPTRSASSARSKSTRSRARRSPGCRARASSDACSGATIAIALCPGRSRAAARGDRRALRRDARARASSTSCGAARALRADARPAVDALRRLPAGVGVPRRRIDRAALRATGIAATRQLAKRQLTWLRATPARRSSRRCRSSPTSSRRSCVRAGPRAPPDSRIAAVQ